MTMIPDDQLQLLTAAVDGELSPPQARALKHLLASSPAARDLLARLKADRARLRALPPAAPPAHLPARILAALPAPQLIIVRPVRREADASRSWSPLVLAASVLVGLAASSFWFFARDGRKPDSAANGRGAPADARGAGEGFADVLPAEGDRAVSAPAPDTTENRAAHAPPQPIDRPLSEQIPEPRAVSRSLNAAPLTPETPPLELVRVRLPFLTPVADLDRDEVGSRLVAELGRDPAARLDLFAKDAGRGVEAVVAAARAGGVTVFADAATSERVEGGRREAGGAGGARAGRRPHSAWDVEGTEAVR
jgi:hypothetical protein